MKKKKKVLHRQIHSVTLSNAMGLRVGGVVVPYYPSYWGGGFGGGGINYGSNTNEGASNANNSDAASNAGGGEGASLSY